MARARTSIPLESKIEKDFLRTAKALRLPVKIRKMNGLGYASWPDRLIIGPMKFIRLIEFKRPEIGKLSPGQEALFKELGEMGHKVLISTDGMKAAHWLRQELQDHGIKIG